MPRFTFPAMAQRQVGDKLNVASKRFEWDGIKWKPVVTSGVPVEAPDIQMVDSGIDYMTVTFTNNDEDPVRFLYEIDDDTPDANMLELSGNETSQNITFSNLSQGTTYTIFLTPVIEGKVVETKSLEHTTLRKTLDPTITDTARTYDTISFTINNTHNFPVTVYYEIGDETPDANTISLDANASESITITGLNSNTAYILYVYAIEDEQVNSDTISGSISTLTYTTETPSVNVTSTGIDSVTFNLTNNDASTVTMYYEVNDSTPDNTVTVNAGQTVSRTVSGLNGGTSYTVYARAQASNENMSSTVSDTFTTDTPPPSTQPIIYLRRFDGSNLHFTFRNRDDNAGTAYYEIDDSSPDITRSVGAYDSFTDISVGGASYGQTKTLYTRMKASGKDFSPVVSNTFTTKSSGSVNYGNGSGNTTQLYYDSRLWVNNIKYPGSGGAVSGNVKDIGTAAGFASDQIQIQPFQTRRDYGIVYSGTNLYTLTETAQAGQWQRILFRAGGLTTNVYIGDFKIRFTNGVERTLQSAVSAGDIEELVLLTSNRPSSAYVWDALNLYNGGNTDTESFPQLQIMFKLRRDATGFRMYSNRQFNTSYDGYRWWKLENFDMSI